MLGRVAVAAFAFVALCAPAIADERSEAMLRGFLAQIDGAEGWAARADAVLSDGSDTVAQGIVIAREAQPVAEIKIERLAVGDLEAWDAGGFSASSIELSNATMTGADAGGRVAYEHSIPAATATDVAMPAFTGVAYDPGRHLTFWASVFAQAAEGEFAEISIPSMVRSIEPVGQPDLGGERTEQTDIRWTDLRDGVVSSIDEGLMVITFDDPAGEGQIRIEASTASEFNLAGFAHIFDVSQYADGRGDGVWQPIASASSQSGVSATAPGMGTFTIDSLTAENIEAQQTARPVTAEWDRLLDPAMASGASADLAIDAAFEMASAWRAGSISLTGLGVDAPSEGVTLSLGEMSFAGLSSLGFDGFRLAAFAMSAPGAAASLDSLDVAGFVFPDSDALRAFAALENDADTQTHTDVVLGAIAGLPRVDRIALSGFSAGPAPDQTVSLAGVTLEMGGWNEFWAESTDLRIDDLAIPGAMLRQNPEAARVMDMMSLDRLVLDTVITDRWNPSQGTDDFSLGIFVQNLFDLEISQTLHGVTTAWISNMSADAGKTKNSHEALAKMMEGLNVERATIRATDHSLLDRALTVAAQMQGLTVDGAAYRQQMRGALPFLLSTVIPPDLAKTISPPLQAFLGGGQTLIADFTPAAPLPVVELIAAVESDPASLPTLLGLEMRTEDAE